MLSKDQEQDEPRFWVSTNRGAATLVAVQLLLALVLLHFLT